MPNDTIPEWAREMAAEAHQMLVASVEPNIETIARALVEAKRRGKLSRGKITLEVLREAFHLDEEAGALIYKERPLWHFSSAYSQARANGQWAGKPAATTHYSGYKKIFFMGKSILVHRVIYALANNVEWNDVPALIDHINQDRSDNRPSNLRPATRSQNQFNKPARRQAKSGIKGIRRRPNGRWCAQITENYNNHWLGTFDTAEEAAAAYNEAASRLHGEFAHFIDADAIRKLMESGDEA